MEELDHLSVLFPNLPRAELESALANSGNDFHAATRHIFAHTFPQHQIHPITLEHIMGFGQRHRPVLVPDSPPEFEQQSQLAPDEPNTIASLLNIFPDACVEFLSAQYKSNAPVQGAAVVEFLASKFVEEGYKKLERVTTKRKRNSEEPVDKKMNQKDEDEETRLYTAEGRPAESREYLAVA